MAKRKSYIRWYNRPIILKVGLFLVFLGGLALLGTRVHDHMLWEESQSWTPTQGEVVRVARMKASGRKAPSGGFGARQPKGSFATYFYTYTVDKTDYRSSRVTYAISGESVDTQKITDLPKVGPATIYVNPDDPTLSVLRVRDDFEYWNIKIAIALFLMAAGGIRFIYALIED